MNSNQLKIVAMITMVLDHIAWVLFPNMIIFHLIGRIAFPIFCYMIAEGYIKTRNRKKYLIRILGIAIISQVPFLMTFRLAFGEGLMGLNTIFDLALGLIAIWIYDKAKFKGKFIIILAIGILAFLLQIDGDICGVLTIYVFYKYHDDFNKMIKNFILVNLIYILIFPVCGIVGSLFMNISIDQIFTAIMQPEYWWGMILQEVLGVFITIIPLKFYNKQKGRSLKILFYSFYPIHLIIIYLIKIYLF